jgi:hypothetical protein
VPWRLLILAVAFVVGLLIAMGETGKWDLILRFICIRIAEPVNQTDAFEEYLNRGEDT